MSLRRNRQEFSQALDDPQKEVFHYLRVTLPLVSRLCQRTKRGGATKIKEQAPRVKPTNKVRENTRKVTPPMKSKQRSMTKTVRTVLIERAIVSQMLILTSSPNSFLARLGFFKFSRTGSKITIVSLIE